MSKNALMHELDAENVWRPVRGTGGANSANSSSANIGISGVFTGTGVDVSQYGTISVSIQASHSSATNGLAFQGSFDNTTWFDMETYTYTASGIKIYSMAPAGKYFRVKYTNGGSATTAFNLLTTFTNAYTKPSSQRVGDTITAENDAELVKSVLAAKKPNGDFVDIDCTAGGNLKVSVEESYPTAYTAKGYQQLTSLSAAAALTVPSGAKVALMQAEAQSVRWRDDGTDPTTTVGMVLNAGESLYFTGSLAGFKAIEVSASAKLNISYYG